MTLGSWTGVVLPVSGLTCRGRFQDAKGLISHGRRTGGESEESYHERTKGTERRAGRAHFLDEQLSNRLHLKAVRKAGQRKSSSGGAWLQPLGIGLKVERLWAFGVAFGCV